MVESWILFDVASMVRDTFFSPLKTPVIRGSHKSKDFKQIWACTYLFGITVSLQSRIYNSSNDCKGAKIFLDSLSDRSFPDMISAFRFLSRNILQQQAVTSN